MKLSQKAKIMGMKHSGATAHLGSDGYTSRNAQEILEFNCRVFNHRFNDRRSYKVSQSFLHGSDLSAPCICGEILIKNMLNLSL